MKKSIQKPQNWQDFETLCKKLWGEIWGIPMKIKKNGRNGQPQSGVDIYGIPNGEDSYWGIQCKGKDEYLGAVLTKKEIDLEIERAKLFQPSLSVFVFATTMNKDAAIEEYIRLRDLENRTNGSFEILLYCWEDIADLIEENRDTYNFYVSNQLHKTKFDFSVVFDENYSIETLIEPTCVRKIKRYILHDEWENLITKDATYTLNILQAIHKKSLPQFNRCNEAICSFEVIMYNTGNSVIEDWDVSFEVIGEHRELMAHLGSGSFGMVDLFALQNSEHYVDGSTITYRPKNNKPLIQKDNKFFKVHVIPKCKEYKIPIKWHLLARDFDMEGELFLNVKPKWEDIILYEVVDSVEGLKDEIISITEKKNYDEDDN